MGFFTPTIERQVYIEAKEYLDKILNNVKEIDNLSVEVYLRAYLATKHDFWIAKQVASEIIRGY